jgi:hypothetical protein
MIVDFLQEAPALTVESVHWQAWWEDVGLWDGFAAYARLDVAMRHTQVYYLREEYGWDPDDREDEDPDTELSWSFESHRWHLLDNGKGTGIQLYKVPVYGRKGE